MPKHDRAFSIDDLWQIERLSGLDLSPDGAQAVCSLGRYDMTDNSARSSLWLLSTLGGKPRALTHCGDKDGQARWSPRGDEIAFVTKRLWQGKQDESPQLYLIAPDGGEARRISDFAPGIESYRWFPDGKRIAFIAWVWPGLKGAKAQAKRLAAFKARKETGYVTSEAQYRYWDHNLPMGRVAHLHVLEVATGRVTDLFEGSPYQLPRSAPDATLFDIAPDGQTIVFCCDPSAEQRIEHCRVLVEVKLRSGKFKVVAQAEGWDLSAPRYRPDGQALALLASHQGKKHTEPEQLAVLPRGEAWSPADHLVASDWDHVPHAPLQWGRDGATLWFGAEARGRCHLWRVELAARRFGVVLHGGNVQDIALAPDPQGGDTAVVLADAMDHPSRVLVVRAGQDPRRIESFNDKLLAGFAFGSTEEVTLAGAQGDPVQMWVVYPPGFDPRKTYPVLHSIHGGRTRRAWTPSTTVGTTSSSPPRAMWWRVSTTTVRAASGRPSSTASPTAGANWNCRMSRRAPTGCCSQPWADPKRVFATGGSYGGYMVAWMNGHVAPGRYQAYVCHAGCFDWTAMFSDDAYHLARTRTRRLVLGRPGQGGRPEPAQLCPAPCTRRRW